jgi:hypothetical protein
MLEQALATLKSATDGWAKSAAECEETLRLAKDNAELHERALRLADHWKFMYELQEKQNTRPTLAPELEARLDKVLKACDVKALAVN